MAANLFTGLNISTWVIWTYFGIGLGPFLIWVYTPVFSSIPPSSFATGVYGNQVFLFRSAAFWFGTLYATLLALLPRYIIRYFRQNYFAHDIDLMRLVRRFHPEVDPSTHPLLGGKFQPKIERDESGETARGEIPLGDMKKAENGESRSRHKANPSQTSVDGFGRHPSARGSAVDSESWLACFVLTSQCLPVFHATRHVVSTLQWKKAE
jgi:phospholipid-translocating ATPase